jgi:hypothetical protein
LFDDEPAGVGVFPCLFESFTHRRNGQLEFALPISEHRYPRKNLLFLGFEFAESLLPRLAFWGHQQLDCRAQATKVAFELRQLCQLRSAVG